MRLMRNSARASSIIAAQTHPTPEGVSRGSLPKNLGEAIEEYRKDPFIREVLGDTIYKKFLEAKLSEWEDYIKQVSPWEVSRYLYKY